METGRRLPDGVSVAPVFGWLVHHFDARAVGRSGAGPAARAAVGCRKCRFVARLCVGHADEAELDVAAGDGVGVGHRDIHTDVRFSVVCHGMRVLDRLAVDFLGQKRCGRLPLTAVVVDQLPELVTRFRGAGDAREANLAAGRKRGDGYAEGPVVAGPYAGYEGMSRAADLALADVGQSFIVVGEGDVARAWSAGRAFLEVGSLALPLKKSW